MRLNTDKPSAEEEMLLKARKEQAEALEFALKAAELLNPPKPVKEKGQYSDLIATIDQLIGEVVGKRKKDVEEEEENDDEEEEEEDDLEEDDEEDFEDEDDFEEEFDDDELDDDDDDIFYDDDDDE